MPFGGPFPGDKTNMKNRLNNLAESPMPFGGPFPGDGKILILGPFSSKNKSPMPFGGPFPGDQRHNPRG